MWRGIVKVTLIGVPVFALLAMLLMGIMRFREVANRARCQDNLRKIGLFGLSEISEQTFVPGDPNSDRTFPAGTIANANLKPEQRLSWMVSVLPVLGQGGLFNQFDLSKGWEDDANHSAVTAIIPAYACPSHYLAPGPGSPQSSAYIGMAGLGTDAPMLRAADPLAGFFRYDEPTKLSMLTRGLSVTITILETMREPGPWAAGGPSTVRGLNLVEMPYIGPGLQFGGHPAGCNAAFADGSVRFQSNSISSEVLEQLIPLADRGIQQ
jgi:prepilin-type processing-associated H-X9-DG protein